MTGNAPLDDRLRDVVVVLRDGNEVSVLDAEASGRVLEYYPSVRRIAARWRLQLGKPGRLLVVDEGLCVEIAEFLIKFDGPRGHGQRPPR